MSAFPTFPTGSVPNSDEFNAILPEFAYKTADESVGPNNTTFQNDDHLFLTGLANAIYTLDTYFQVIGAGSNAAGNIKYQWTMTSIAAGVDFWWSGEGMATTDILAGAAEGKNSHLATRTGAASPSGTQIFGTPSANWVGIIGRGLFQVGPVANTLTLQWAQSVNSATSTQMRAGSWIKLVRVV